MAIEAGISFMVMMTMLLGIMECCMMGYSYSVLEDAAPGGARYAIIHGTDSASCSGPSTGCADSTGANVVSDVKVYANVFTKADPNLNVTVTYPDGTSTPESRVQVTITETYQPVFHLPLSSPTLTVSSEGRILY